MSREKKTVELSKEILEDLKWRFEDIVASDFKFKLEDDDEIQLWLSVAEIRALLELMKKEVN